MFGWWRKRSRGRRKAPQRPRGFRPWLEPLEDRLAPAVYTVINVGDTGQGMGLTGDLRYAITQSNTSVGVADQIHFNIGGGGLQVIQLANALPIITDSVTIDGGTQPGFAGTPIIVLNGPGVFGNGLDITAGNTTVRALVIHNFIGNGIRISGPGGNHIENNYIGTNTTGTVNAPNTGSGILIQDSPDNVIGGDVPGTGNLISGNQDHGIYIWDPGSQRNVVRRNIIGADITGTAKLANGDDGIHLAFGARNNTIGGDYSTQGNLISGNTLNGITLSGSETLGNKVLGNDIGTKMGGLEALGNGQNGVLIEGGASSNEIGQSRTENTHNVISGNDQRGVYIKDSTTTLNKVRGNYIGLGADGDTEVENKGTAGVVIENATDNTIGGSAALGQGNVISGNAGHGIAIFGSGAVSNDVLGNLIGTDHTGNLERGNTWNGVRVSSGARETIIGGAQANSRNVISGNKQEGIYISNANFTRVTGNYIGVDIDGNTALGNRDGGVTVTFGSEDTFIGGAQEGEGNVISGNGTPANHVGPNFGNGIALLGHSIRTTVQGNLVGTDKTGNNKIANKRSGVYIDVTSSGNTIGGVEAGRNWISGNERYGVEVDGNNNTIDFNTIGLKKDGSGALPNDLGWRLDIGMGNTWGPNNQHN